MRIFQVLQLTGYSEGLTIFRQIRECDRVLLSEYISYGTIPRLFTDYLCLGKVNHQSLQV